MTHTTKQMILAAVTTAVITERPNEIHIAVNTQSDRVMCELITIQQELLED